MVHIRLSSAYLICCLDGLASSKELDSGLNEALDRCCGLNIGLNGVYELKDVRAWVLFDSGASLSQGHGQQGFLHTSSAHYHHQSFRCTQSGLLSATVRHTEFIENGGERPQKLIHGLR